MYVIIAILIFGILIAVHELGHFLAAKGCGVRVLEFSIGMGPAIFKRQRGETLYSLRALPIGGFCAMEGEDSESNDPRAFSNQRVWKRVLILVAGSAMNFLLGFLVILAIVGSMTLLKPTITGFMDGCPYEGENGLMEGDTFYKINGERIYFSTNVSTFMERGDNGLMDIVVIRDGEKIYLEDYPMTPREYTDENGETTLKYGLYFGVYEEGVGARLKNAWYCAMDFVRMVRMGLSDLVTGAVGIKDMSGVVGIVDVISDVGHQSETAALAALNIAYLSAFIAINLAVMNMLPIPALDGGRIFFLLITWVVERVSKRKINPKYEGYIHAAGLVLLVGLMALVMINDVIRIFTA